jgi:glycosyltransferase involved in cell wall biosynthesis
MSATITAIIPAKNEEHNIARCIESLRWCDKIVVLWMGNDDTKKIAESLGATVVTRNQKNNDDFVAVQENINWAIEKAETDWILRIDADEVVTKALQKEILAILNGNIDKSIAAYRIPRRHYIFGGFLKGGDWAYDKLVRLFRPTCARYDPIVHVHEQFTVNGRIALLSEYIDHYSHPTLDMAIQKINTYTTMEKFQMTDSTKTAYAKMLILPPYIFLRWMIWHHGYRDGLRGIVAATVRSFYDFLLYAKYIEYKMKKDNNP